MVNCNLIHTVFSILKFFVDVWLIPRSQSSAFKVNDAIIFILKKINILGSLHDLRPSGFEVQILCLDVLIN